MLEEVPVVLVFLPFLPITRCSLDACSAVCKTVVVVVGSFPCCRYKDLRNDMTANPATTRNQWYSRVDEVIGFLERVSVWASECGRERSTCYRGLNTIEAIDICWDNLQ